jgi:dCMP deaminase
MKIAQVVAERSTCLRRQVGAVLVKEKRLLTTGYNGAPAGLPHCLDTGCLRLQQGVPSGQRHELCRGLHAEQNTIIQAALHGVSIRDAVLYCTHHPCSLCARMLVNGGITRVVLWESYPDPLAQKLFVEAAIPVETLAETAGDGDAALNN